MKDVCISLFKKEQEDRLYKNYIAECLRITTENTAKAVALIGGGKEEIKYISVSFDDILNPKPVDERTADEIITDIKEKLQKIGGENE